MSYGPIQYKFGRVRGGDDNESNLQETHPSTSGQFLTPSGPVLQMLPNSTKNDGGELAPQK